MFHTRLYDIVLVRHDIHMSAGLHITCDFNTTSNGPLETRRFNLIVSACHNVMGINLDHAKNNYDNKLEVHRLGDGGRLLNLSGDFTSITSSINVTSV